MTAIRHWRNLSPEEQLRLREDFGHHLDRLPPTCDLDDKIQRFQQWLAERNIHVDKRDLNR